MRTVTRLSLTSASLSDVAADALIIGVGRKGRSMVVAPGATGDLGGLRPVAARGRHRLSHPVAGPNEDGSYGVVTRGFAPADQVLAVLQTWVAESGAHALN